MAISWRISGGKLAATEETEFTLGAQPGTMTTSIQTNPIASKVLPVIEPCQEGGPPIVQEVAQLERHDLSPATLGLTLSEAKTLLHNLQSHLVEQQVSAVMF